MLIIGFAKEFASRGFNIFVISRTESKLQALCSELESEYQVSTRYLPKDFTKAYESEFFEDIYKNTEDIDVSVLINNVGMVNMKSHPDAKKDDIKDVITVNTYSQALLSHEFLNRMLKRENRSAIIDMSSFSGGKPVSV